MAETFVEDEFDRDTAIFQRLVELIGIGRGNALVLFALLDERGCLRLVHVGDGRGFAVDFRVFPRGGFQVLAGERMDIGIDVVRHPVRDSGAHGNRFETIAETGDEGRDVAALAPAHGADSVLIHHAFADQVIDAGDDIGIVADAQVADIERAEVGAVAGRAAIVRLQKQRAAGGEAFHGIVAVGGE